MTTFLRFSHISGPKRFLFTSFPNFDAFKLFIVGINFDELLPQTVSDVEVGVSDVADDVIHGVH